VADLGPLRFRLVAIPVGKPDLDELVASLLEGSAMDVGVIEVPLSVTFEKHSPHGNLRVGGVVPRGLGVPGSRDRDDTQANETGPRGQATDADFVPGYGTRADEQRRLDEILRDLDVQRHMPEEDVARLSAEASRLRARLDARGSEIVDVEPVHPRAVTPATIGKTPRSQAVRRETRGS
jgi:hypothetical protein